MNFKPSNKHINTKHQNHILGNKRELFVVKVTLRFTYSESHILFAVTVSACMHKSHYVCRTSFCEN